MLVEQRQIESNDLGRLCICLAPLPLEVDSALLLSQHHPNCTSLTNRESAHTNVLSCVEGFSKDGTNAAPGRGGKFMQMGSLDLTPPFLGDSDFSASLTCALEVNCSSVESWWCGEN